MKRSEFALWLATDRQAAINALIDHKVDRMMNEGPDEIKRVLHIWSEPRNCMPMLLLGPNDLLIEMALADELIEEEPAADETPLGQALANHFRELLGTAGVMVSDHLDELLDLMAADIDERPRETHDDAGE